jgi:hypothetical protein
VNKVNIFQNSNDQLSLVFRYFPVTKGLVVTGKPKVNKVNEKTAFYSLFFLTLKAKVNKIENERGYLQNAEIKNI